MSRGGLVTIRTTGLGELRKTLQLVDVTIAKDWDTVFRGAVTPTPCPGLSAKVVDAPKTLEVAIQESFDRGGPSALQSDVWADLSREPKYAAHKARRGGGSNMLVWAGSKRPLRDSFKVGNPRNVFRVSGLSMMYGTIVTYAARLQAGGFWQPWDETDNIEARVMLQATETWATEVARGMQRVLRGRLGQEAFAAARREPRL